MKKSLLTILAAAGFGLTANAQLPVGSVAPDFTLTDINGQSHHLYNYLDSGYAVIIDISAAWCGPCWSAHNSHVFEDLTDHYGPNGTITPKKIKFIFIEGEAANTTDQLYGIAGSGSAGTTQGNWVAGTNYPIIDNASMNTAYNLGGFPTFTVICRDRLVAAAPVGYGSSMGQESYWLNIINNGCPNYAPAATLDAKAVKYNGQDYFVCNATPTVKFQNYSQTNNITNATIEVLNGSTVVSTYNWTGNLAPMAVASVNVPSFSPSAFMPYKFRVTVAGDAMASNNTSNDSLFKVFTAANAGSMPYTQDFETITDFPANFGGPSDGNIFVVSNFNSLIGANGSVTDATVINFYNMTAGETSELFMGNYNTQNATNVFLNFDVSYAQYSTGANAEDDKLEVMVSTNCGQNWTTVWSKSGNTLKTHAPVGNNTEYVPGAAADWRKETVNLNAYKNANMLIKLKATSDYGNYAWIDNINVSSTALGIDDVVTKNSIKVYPNPATNMANVAFNLTNSTNVQISVLDATGRLVSMVANENMTPGNHQVQISTANLTPGLYNVKIQTEAGSTVEQLSVIK